MSLVPLDTATGPATLVFCVLCACFGVRFVFVATMPIHPSSSSAHNALPAARACTFDAAFDALYANGHEIASQSDIIVRSFSLFSGCSGRQRRTLTRDTRRWGWVAAHIATALPSTTGIEVE